MNNMISLQKSLGHIIKLLNDQVDMNLWMFTRVIEDDWIIVACSQNELGLKAGDVLPWNESICFQMVIKKGPNFVPDIKLEEAYFNAPLAKRLSISSYIGMSMLNENNELLGTLCAIDINTKSNSIANKQTTITSFLEIAETIINQHDTILRLEKALAYLEAQSSIDDVTGLPKQDAFFSHALVTKAKYDKLACPLGVIIVEVSGLKINKGNDSIMYDDLLRALSSDLKALLRESDYLAKLDGSKFGIILVNVENRFVSSLVLKISKQLSRFNLRVSIGADVCRQSDCIEDSIEHANANKMI